MTFDVLFIEDEEEYILETVDGLNISGKPDFGVIPDYYLNAKSFYTSAKLNLKGLQFSLALVDFNLPGGINGDEVIAEIRKHNQNYDLTIIFYSADKTPGELKNIIEEKIGSELIGILYSSKETLEDECYRFFKERLEELQK